MSEPVIDSQHFFRRKITSLVDVHSDAVNEYVQSHPSIKLVADGIIRDIQYPFYMGRPDDKHTYNAYHGKWCHTIELDYWQTAEETLTIKIGDCEDSSIAFVACARHFLPETKVFECFGVVRNEQGQILGGHGWSYFYLEGWRLYESTLDVPPIEYPIVGKELNDIQSPVKIGNVIYDPEFLFNDKKYIPIANITYYKEGTSMQNKETKEKYEAIERAWRIQTKFMLQYKTVKSKIARTFRSIIRR